MACAATSSLAQAKASPLRHALRRTRIRSPRCRERCDEFSATRQASAICRPQEWAHKGSAWYRSSGAPAGVRVRVCASLLTLCCLNTDAQREFRRGGTLLPILFPPPSQAGFFILRQSGEGPERQRRAYAGAGGIL